MAQKVVNSAQTAAKTNTAQTAAKTNATQTAAKTNTAQAANKLQGGSATTPATSSPYGGMNYDTYLKSQGKDTGYTPTETKYAPDGTAYTVSASPSSGDTTKYAPDGTAYTVSSGTTGNAAAGTTGATGTAGTTSNGSTNILTPYLPGNTPDFLAKLGVTEGDNGGFPQDNGGQPSGGGGHASTSIGGYTAAQLTPATSQADYINAMYDANEQRQRAALETAYDANVATLNQQEAKIAPQYQQAANAAAAQSAVAQAAFNERAAAAGMNTGAGSQAALAQNNALQSNISSIRQAESEALAEVEAQRASLSQQYQKAIAEAVANNEAERAQALYAEAVRVDESLVSTAANQAAENFNAWQAAYKLAKG